jgi:CubicO group peptidase (beta-lactamase class C family)
MALSGTTRRTLLMRALDGAGVAFAGPLLPAALLTVPSPAFAQFAPNAGEPLEPTATERAAIAGLARSFMQQYDVPGLSVTVGRGGVLVYQDAFGYADREHSEALNPAHLFRIASVSKTITSVTIFSLIEQGRLRLTDKIFGPGAILGTDYGRPPYHPRVDQITLEHLLTHTSGGWNNQYADPMFSNPSWNQSQLIEWTLRNRPLDHPPGESYAYSNFGYCVLGRVIEKITREAYSRYVISAVLKHCGIADMAIAGNTLSERRHGEVRYYGQGDDPYGMNVTRMDSHGGWIARPADLVQFVMHVSGFATPPNVLKPETIQVMTTGSAANASYAKGWAVNKANNWWHNGSLPGTATIAVRARSGFCWAAFTNTRRAKSALDGDLDRLVWKMVAQVKEWRA